MAPPRARGGAGTDRSPDVSAPPQGARSRDPSGWQRPRGTPSPPRLTDGRPYPAQARAASRGNPASPQLALPARLPSEALPPAMRLRPGAGAARSHARGHIRHLPPRASGATARALTLRMAPGPSRPG